MSLLVGSFLNVVIHRLPIMLDRQWRTQAREMLADAASAPSSSPQPSAHSPQPSALSPQPPPSRYNLLVPPSACPHCAAPIRAHQNIPVISWLLLGGKCANCKAPISPRYPIVELATALLSAAVVWRFGFHWQSIAALFVTWALVALTVIDLDHQILPDIITIPLLWLGLLASLAWHPGLAAPIPTDSWSAILGAAAGYLSLWSVYWAFKLLTGKEGMGYGDFKLFAAFGAWMGWQMLPLVILLAAMTGAAVGIALIVLRGRDRNIPIPFGPYLAAAGWIALMWGPQIVGGYLHLAGLDH
ncbi:MAG TPA: A24 family peptidase [Burkholderiaceae bacterium]|nr:A24 family peptidase [Burkholderiaceae bacterium]